MWPPKVIAPVLFTQTIEECLTITAHHYRNSLINTPDSAADGKILNKSAVRERQRVFMRWFLILESDKLGYDLDFAQNNEGLLL